MDGLKASAEGVRGSAANDSETKDRREIFILLLLNLTNNKGTIITAMKGVVVYANYQTRFRFKEL